MVKKTTQNNRTFLQKFWLPIVLAILTLVGTIVTVLGPATLENILANPTRSQPENFDYQVHIESSGTPVVNATVTIEIGGGKVPLDTISDSTGLARIIIDKSYLEKPGRLIIRATGYKPFTQNIDLVGGNLPKIIQLEPNP